MAGKWSRNARPARAGAYFNFVAAEAEPVLVSTLGTVVVPFTHSWGPSEEIVELASFGDFLTIYGRGLPSSSPEGVFTPGYQAVHDAFRGEGLPGKAGAGRVLAYRQVGAAAAKASTNVDNTTPAAAITITAIYDGDYGEQISVANIVNALDGAKRDFIVYVEGVEAERFTYAATNITDLSEQINGSGAYAGRASSWVRASGVTSGTALETIATTSPDSLTGGNDGTALLAADWTDLMSDLEPQRFSILAAQGLNGTADSTVVTSLKTWATDQNDKGKRFLTVVAGGSTGTPDTMSAALARSASLDSEHFVNLGGGVYSDDKFGTVHPTQLVARIAGILAQRGEDKSITFARLAGLSVLTGVTEAEILAAIAGGVVTLSRDSNQAAPVRIEKGVTTLRTDSSAKSKAIYGVPKFVRTMGSIETELTEFAEANVIGQMPVNAGTRDYLRGQMEARLEAREAAGVIQPGWFVQISQDPAPTDEDDFIALDYSIKFGRSLEQVLNTVTVG